MSSADLKRRIDSLERGFTQYQASEFRVLMEKFVGEMIGRCEAVALDRETTDVKRGQAVVERDTWTSMLTVPLLAYRSEQRKIQALIELEEKAERVIAMKAKENSEQDENDGKPAAEQKGRVSQPWRGRGTGRTRRSV